MSKVFIVDCDLCNGCHSCQIACKDEHCGNNWMPYAMPQPETGQFWCKLEHHIRGTVGKALDDEPTVRESSKVKSSYVFRICQHCDDAPCIEACQSNAIIKRDDGLVWIDPKKCTGNQNCVEACPYGVIYFNRDLYQAQKCTGCAHILDRGYPINEPRCVDACITGMLKFGEEDDFSDFIDGAERLEPNFGETPDTRVYYKNLPKRFIGGTVYDPGEEEVVIGAECTLECCEFTGEPIGFTPLEPGDTTTATTDNFGDFWFEGLPVGIYNLTIEANGKSETIDGINTENDVNLGDIALS